ncbi:hypothetical protein GCM10022243_01400 [Saccharothrix violaceirubra]|uniref:Glycosyl transferase family 2 n=1 Tax=Saccharothrix violaceirubra TaxID=413306 RepID=A0A7W7T2L7_9PSEU|nr:glycosyltransferase [Saccharothrix violaceirubra]MBB4965361.1 hypothetical protein [Saccharothrix violaceirubra]
MPVSYVLSLRWSGDHGLAGLTAYLRWLADRCEVVVADGSPERVFVAHAQRWSGWITHVRVGSAGPGRNGKVLGVHVGIRAARHEKVVIADDDVRYDDAALAGVAASLDDTDLVAPQNYFGPLPWHARWDTARILLNRAFGGDYPGTFGIRRPVFLDMGGYRDDVLFENLELMRTVSAAGGRVLRAADLFVRREPPTAVHFRSQRVRQAYDSLAQPARLCVELAVLPVVAIAVVRRKGVVAAVSGTMASAFLAELGRRRAGGTRVFPATVPLFAPLWVAERAVCAWVAVAHRVLLGGVRYGGGRLRVAAYSAREGHRMAGGCGATISGGGRPLRARRGDRQVGRREAEE